MSRIHTASFALAATVAVGLSTPVFAQDLQAPTRPRSAPAQPVAPEAQQPVVVYQNSQTARDVQQQLREVLDRYPPSVRQLIQLDPTLMSRPDYMATYPQLQGFLQQHPEVVRNPTFYFGSPYNDYERDLSDRQRTLNVVKNTIEGIGFLTGFLTVISFIYSLLRQALEYRRWRRQVQIQTDVHTKLLDRMTNNQELLAYMETASGRRFLEAPIAMSGPSSSLGSTLAPLTRILWSVQIGVVVVAAGIGFWIATTTIVDADLAVVFQVMGSLAIAVGVGFVVSAILSWALSQRMGLIAPPAVKVE
jgi:hypothetical protein